MKEITITNIWGRTHNYKDVNDYVITAKRYEIIYEQGKKGVSGLMCNVKEVLISEGN